MLDCYNIPRVLISATSSGAGKTTITCGLIKAFLNRKLNLSSFKCGPDYIDPLFHKQILGKSSTNLDLFFMENDFLIQTFLKHASNSNIAIIEGVMGYYDGLGGCTSTASAYDVACVLDCPTVLIVDAKGASFSIIATIQGFVNLFPNSKIKAVVLNRCNKMIFDLLSPIIIEKCGVIPIGFLPFDEDFSIESRHLGLVTASEILDLQEKINKIAFAIEQNFDLDLLLKLSSNSLSNFNYLNEYKNYSLNHNIFPMLDFNTKPIIGVALDKAFCFYYNETFDLFEKLGFHIEFFSPLTDNSIPQNCSVLYFGGGYPELYLEQLQDNITMKNSIVSAINLNIITIAECGGYMYLGNSIDGKQMVGAINSDFYNTKKLSRFGYIDLTANCDNVLACKNQVLKAHEFHYYDSDFNGDTFTASKPIGKKTWQACYSFNNLLAGFPHFYLPSFCYTKTDF